MNPRLDSLLNRWIDGELAEPEAEAVQRMLAEDPEARRICYELLMVDHLLDEKFQGALEKTSTVASKELPLKIEDKPRRRRFALIAAMAAVVAISLIGLFFTEKKPVETLTGPQITGSTDSRITIAQRQETKNWAVGELLRLERGTADIRLSRNVGAHFQGPSAIELLNQEGSVRLLEGLASFVVGAGSGSVASEVHTAGGMLRSLDCRYITEVLADGDCNIKVEAGFLEIRPRGQAPVVYLKSGDSIRLSPDGSSLAIRLPDYHFRSSLPEQLILFHDEFNVEKDTFLAEHKPEVGQSWEVLTELNPTIVRKQRLDTSSGARRIVANLTNHGKQGTRAVYIASFDLLPPARIGDKKDRLGGIEYITLQDAAGKDILSIAAKASNSHRWQLVDERTKASSALTQVCSLWTHSLTLCYGLDGLVTLHDGATAQSPIIAELRVADPPAAAKILLGNFDGGDLALSRIETLLLPSPPQDDL